MAVTVTPTSWLISELIIVLYTGANLCLADITSFEGFLVNIDELIAPGEGPVAAEQPAQPATPTASNQPDTSRRKVLSSWNSRKHAESQQAGYAPASITTHALPELQPASQRTGMRDPNQG